MCLQSRASPKFHGTFRTLVSLKLELMNFRLAFWSLGMRILVKNQIMYIGESLMADFTSVNGFQKVNHFIDVQIMLDFQDICIFVQTSTRLFIRFEIKIKNSFALNFFLWFDLDVFCQLLKRSKSFLDFAGLFFLLQIFQIKDFFNVFGILNLKDIFFVFQVGSWNREISFVLRSLDINLVVILAGFRNTSSILVFQTNFKYSV